MKKMSKNHKLKLLVVLSAILISVLSFVHSKSKPHKVNFIGCQWLIPPYYEKIHDDYYIDMTGGVDEYTTISFSENTDESWTIETPTEIIDVVAVDKKNNLTVVKLLSNDKFSMSDVPALRIKNDNSQFYALISSLGDVEYDDAGGFTVINKNRTEFIRVSCK